MVKETSSTAAADIAIKTINENKQCLVFVNSKKSAEKMADDISAKLKELPELVDITKQAVNSLTRPTKQCLRLGRSLAKGVAFHHAGLNSKQREIIENNFRSGKVKVIACTPTLAVGLDMPAFRVVIRDLKRYGGRFGMTPIPVLEYHQMAGRAGRPGKEKYGEAIVLATNESEKEYNLHTYLRGKPEEIYSKLAVEPVLRTYVLSLVASGFIHTKYHLLKFFKKTFWAKQFHDDEKLQHIVDKVINLLKEYEFLSVKINDNYDDINTLKKDTRKESSEISLSDLNENDDDVLSDFVSADKLVKNNTNSEDQISGPDYKLRATAIGKRVAELYIDPLTANRLIVMLKRANDRMDSGKVNYFSFLQIISNTIEMMPLLRVKVRETDLINDKLAELDDFILENEPSIYDADYEDFMNGIKTAMFFESWVNESDEESILERFDVRPGEIKYKLDKAEWLFYACIEFANILELKKITSELRKIDVRIKHGVKEELLPLLKLKQIGRIRARNLFNNNIKSIKDVKATDITSLSTILGTKIANNVKEQLNQKEADEIPKGTRKGQLSIEKFV